MLSTYLMMNTASFHVVGIMHWARADLLEIDDYLQRESPSAAARGAH